MDEDLGPRQAKASECESSDVKTLLALALAIASVAISFQAFALEPDTKVISFAVGWRTSAGQPENKVQLGVIYRCQNAWCASVESFSGKRNYSRRAIEVRHQMLSPYQRLNCNDEYLTTVEGIVDETIQVAMEKDGDGLTLTVGTYAYAWTQELSATGSYVLAGVKDLRTGGSLEQPVGFAYEGSESASELTGLDKLSGLFIGEIDHKDMLTGVFGEWRHTATSIDFRKFHRHADGAEVAAYSQPGHPDVLKRMSFPVWVHHSLAIVPMRAERLRYVLHEYGHDFNGNGCFDEFGHNKLMLPVQRNGDTIALVFVEYTPDKRDGVPMLSVGRYFRKH